MEQYCAIIKCVQNFSPKKGKVYFMKVKQWLASSLAVLMLVSTVGCGDNSSSSKAESKSNNSSAVREYLILADTCHFLYSRLYIQPQTAAVVLTACFPCKHAVPAIIVSVLIS